MIKVLSASILTNIGLAGALIGGGIWAFDYITWIDRTRVLYNEERRSEAEIRTKAYHEGYSQRDYELNNIKKDYEDKTKKLKDLTKQEILSTIKRPDNKERADWQNVINCYKDHVERKQTSSISLTCNVQYEEIKTLYRAPVVKYMNYQKDLHKKLVFDRKTHDPSKVSWWKYRTQRGELVNDIKQIKDSDLFIDKYDLVLVNSEDKLDGGVYVFKEVCKRIWADDIKAYRVNKTLRSETFDQTLWKIDNHYVDDYEYWSKWNKSDCETKFDIGRIGYYA